MLSVSSLVMTCSAFVVLSLLTIQRNSIWRDNKTLWEVTSRQSPNVARVWYNLGVLAQEEYDQEKAKEYYKKALSINPNYVEARSNLATLWNEDSQRGKAKAGYESLLAAAPKTYVPYMNYGRLLMGERRWEEAASVFKDIQKKFPYEKHPTDEVNILLAKCYAYSGQDALSDKTFERVNYFCPDKAKARFDLGDAFETAGDLKKAEYQYRKALTDRPNWAEAEMNLGVVLHHEGRLREAEKTIKAGLSHKPQRAAAITTWASSTATWGNWTWRKSP